MDKLYIVVGTILCLLFIYTTALGLDSGNVYSSTTNRPTGPGSHYYHK
ncbi:MAG: hypothetical protein KGS72_23640 [Cyanobacteria bacterium REEB67]|nr:hypothetical protein [Cyanobacteria bacterium REEB67]